MADSAHLDAILALAREATSPSPAQLARLRQFAIALETMDPPDVSEWLTGTGPELGQTRGFSESEVRVIGVARPGSAHVLRQPHWAYVAVSCAAIISLALIFRTGWGGSVSLLPEHGSTQAGRHDESDDSARHALDSTGPQTDSPRGKAMAEAESSAEARRTKIPDPRGWRLGGSQPEAYEFGEGPLAGEGAGDRDRERWIRSRLEMRDIKEDGFGSLANQMSAAEVRGCRVRFSALVKVRDVVDLAALWLRIVDRSGQVRAFDNMRTRPIRGTAEWSRYEIVLDVPEDAERLDFGAMLSATGEVSIKDVVVESFPPTTVSRLREGWRLAGVRVDAYEIGEFVEHGVVASHYLRSVKEASDGNGRLMLSTTAEDAQGERLRLAADVRTDRVAGWAGLWMLARAAGPEDLAAKDMKQRPIRGTTGWRRYEVELDVPADAKSVAFGIQLRGSGQVQLRNVSVQTVAKARARQQGQAPSPR